jgi:hypothetical protein
LSVPFLDAILIDTDRIDPDKSVFVGLPQASQSIVAVSCHPKIPEAMCILALDAYFDFIGCVAPSVG